MFYLSHGLHLTMKTLPGINIQWPWSQLILSGAKTVETRRYDLPAKYLGVPLAMIETPGLLGRKEAGIKKARIIGVVTFVQTLQYQSASAWRADYERHLVPTDDPQYKYVKGQPKWGWVVASVEALPSPVSPPTKRGIVFATACRIPDKSKS